jgi:hypothetical protein
MKGVKRASRLLCRTLPASEDHLGIVLFCLRSLAFGTSPTRPGRAGGLNLLKIPFYGKFIKKPASSQNWAEVYLQYGVRIFRLPNCGVRERSDGTVVGSFKIAGSSPGNSLPVGRMKASGLVEIVMSRL